MKRRIVTTTAVFDPGYPAEKAAERLATLGYEALDMALDYWTGDGSPFLSDTYLAWAESLRKRAEGLGIPYTHSHAPGEADGRLTARSIETAGALGAGFMVLHPIWRENGEIIEDRDRFIRVNADAVKPWLATAKDAGVVILSENLLWGASKDPRVIAELAAAVGSEHFGWCFDTGHANIFAYQPDVLRSCAVPPSSLHLQDNHGGGDEHLIPGEGTIDWGGIVGALAAVGYACDCVLEAHHQSLDAPDDERDAILTRLLGAAKKLRADMTALDGKVNDI